MAERNEKGVNARLVAEFVTSLRFTDIPQGVVQMAKKCLLDFLGIAVAGTAMPAAESGLALLDAFGKKEEATVITRARKVPSVAAAWGNALLGSILDMEGGHYISLSHPASIVFPVALALAERENSAPKEFLAACIAGYEVAVRCGILMGKIYRERTYGFGAAGSYAGAAVGARLLGLDNKGVERALGIAGCYMPNVPVVRGMQHEAMTKGGSPWGAVVGVVSALLAGSNFTAPPATLQDPFAPVDDDEALPVLQDLGEVFEIKNAYFKKYPSCRWTHAPLDATTSILQEHNIDSSHVAHVRVETFKEALALGLRRPTTLEGVEDSIPFTVALAIVEGDFTEREMVLEKLVDCEVGKIADKVELALDPDLDSLFPQYRPARVIITTDDGASFTKEVIAIHGEPGSAFISFGVQAKFMRLVSDRLGSDFANELYSAVDDLDTMVSLQPLIRLLAGSL